MTRKDRQRIGRYLRQHLGDGVELVSEVRHWPTCPDEGAQDGAAIAEDAGPDVTAIVDTDKVPTPVVTEQPKSHNEQVIEGIRKLPVEPIAPDRPVIDCTDAAFAQTFSFEEVAKACGLSRPERRRISSDKAMRNHRHWCR